MRDYEAYIFDLDGTLYRGDQPIPSALAALDRLRTRGRTIRFLTNNSSQTVESVAAKLARMGYAAEPEEIETSATGSAAYLAGLGVRSVQCLGEPGLVETIQRSGINAFGPDVPWDDAAEAVVAGIFRQFTYAHLAKAMHSIRAGSRFIATNADATYPVEGELLTPGAGSIVAAVQTCAEQEPFIVGKPSPYLTRRVLEKAGIAPDRTLVIGDRMDTDIESGKAAGCDTLLVLTGVTKVAPPGQLYAPDLGEL